MNIWQNKNWKPMLLKEVEKPFNNKDYLFEVKFDGIRAIIFATSEKVIVQTRNKQDITNLFPELQKISKLVKAKTIFDGEIVAFNNNLPSFGKLQERTHLKNKTKINTQSQENPIIFMCFDIIYQNKDLTNLSLLARKKILATIKDNDVFIKTNYVEENGKALFQSIKKLGLEGIVAKEKRSLYNINTRTASWLKIKNFKQEKFVIGGYSDKNKNESITLYLGELRDKKLYFVGKVSLAKKYKLYTEIKKSKILKKSPFIDFTTNINFLNPHMTCFVQYIERTKNNHLRQPIYKNI